MDRFFFDLTPLYSIIIPVHNEAKAIPELLDKLRVFSKAGHEILIIDDGSTDNSAQIISRCNYVKNIRIEINIGKGGAIKKGLYNVSNERIIIFDGDLELNPLEISKLMILNRRNGIYSVMGYRFNTLNPIKSSFDWGNFIFTSFFNIVFQSNHKDILCCAKSFYLDKINMHNLLSDGFDIDVELSSILTLNNKEKIIPQVLLNYKRRSRKEGKKLEISDGWLILARIIKIIKYK